MHRSGKGRGTIWLVVALAFGFGTPAGAAGDGPGWARQFGSGSADEALGVALDNAGDAYVVGWTGRNVARARSRRGPSTPSSGSWIRRGASYGPASSGAGRLTSPGPWPSTVPGTPTWWAKPTAPCPDSRRRAAMTPSCGSTTPPATKCGPASSGAAAAKERREWPLMRPAMPTWWAAPVPLCPSSHRRAASTPSCASTTPPATRFGPASSAAGRTTSPGP